MIKLFRSKKANRLLAKIEALEFKVDWFKRRESFYKGRYEKIVLQNQRLTAELLTYKSEELNDVCEVQNDC